MKDVLIQLMLYVGIALMALNIVKYLRFSIMVSTQGNWKREIRILRLPIILLILFFGGYVAVTVFGQPDFVVAGILLGGSIFVHIMVILMQRITDRIHLNEQMEAEMEAAKRASEVKTRFLSNMSHDLLTPMNAIIGYTVLALKNEELSKETKQYLEKIDYSSKHLLSLINDILDMSRIESGKMELMVAPSDLVKTLDETYDIFIRQMQEKKLKFTVDHSGVTHRFAVFDKNRLNRIILNLISNAMKFTPENGEIKVTLTEVGKNDGSCNYELRVKDNGMSAEFAEHIFEAFERERNETVSNIQGTGLGMSITKSLVSMMNGDIRVETKEGSGTEFIIRLTFSEANGEDITKLEKENKQETKDNDFSGMTLLLAEDNVINKEIACAILKSVGFEVEHAENGKIALDMVKASEAGKYDAILMDIQMPVMNGYEATKAIRSLDSDKANVPIIAMSANAFDEDVENALAAGMNAHIAKPIDIAVMMKTLSDVLKSAVGSW